jgi:tripartite-type tricarboxylate transporter receptor subunit TctC
MHRQGKSRMMRVKHSDREEAMRLSILAVALVALAGATAAGAQSYPSRPVTIVVPYPAGGPTDQVARQVAPKLAAKLGQNFIVENVSGGGTNIAGQRVARSAPDGHTLFIHNLQISANVALYKTLPFDTEKDFTPIAMINSNPLVLVGKKDLAAKTLPELAAWMKTTPARMGHPGTGSTGHLATFLLAQALGVEVTHVPYRGAAPMLQDVLGGHLELFFATPQQVVGQFASGAVKVFGITSKETSPQFPGVPSFVAAYGPKLEISFWHIMLAPAGTPRPIVDALNGALQEALADPDILKAWGASGMAPYPAAQRTPEGAAAYLKKEIAHWGEVVRENKIEAPAN